MSEYIEVMGVEELDDGEMHEVEVEDHAILVARVADDIYITDARCPHLHAHLANGSLEGTTLTCPWHGSQFDITDGSVVRWTDFEGVVKTMAQMVRHARPLRTYEVLIDDGKIFVGSEKEPPSRS